MEEENIAKNNVKREAMESTDDSTSAETANGEQPEMPEELNGEMPDDAKNMEMGGGPMGGGFPGEMTAMTTVETNEWLVPMTATGIISGTIILATIAVCLTIFFTNKKKN